MGEALNKVLEGKKLPKLSDPPKIPASTNFIPVEDLPSEKRIKVQKEKYYETLVKSDLTKKFSKRPALVTAEMLLDMKAELVKISANTYALEENDLLRTQLDELKAKNEALNKFTTQLQDEIKFQIQERKDETEKLKGILMEISESDPAEILARIVSKETTSKDAIKDLHNIVNRAKEACK